MECRAEAMHTKTAPLGGPGPATRAGIHRTQATLTIFREPLQMRFPGILRGGSRFVNDVRNERTLHLPAAEVDGVLDPEGQRSRQTGESMFAFWLE